MLHAMFSLDFLTWHLPFYSVDKIFPGDGLLDGSNLHRDMEDHGDVVLPPPSPHSDREDADQGWRLSSEFH